MLNSSTHSIGNSLVYVVDKESKQDPCILWKTALRNSKSYFEKLDLTPPELEIIKNNAPPSPTGEQHRDSNFEERSFLFVTIKEKQFRLVFQNVSGRDYGEDWKDLILVFCINDSSLNTGTGGGTTRINVVPDEWHELLLDKLQGEFILDFKNRISAVISRNQRLWNQVKVHSEEICARLGIEINELEIVKSCLQSVKISESQNNFMGEEKEIRFSLQEKSFKLDINSIFGPSRGDGSMTLIQVVCTNDASLNESMGGVTSFVNIIDEQWHRLLLHPSQNAIIDDLKRRISAGQSRNMRLWKQLQVNSDEICQRLGCSNSDLTEMKDCLAKNLTQSYAGIKFNNGFLLELECREFKKKRLFSFKASKICGANYGGTWKNLISVTCINDESLNQRTGGGTTLVNIINEHWHKLLLTKLETLVIDREKKSQALQASGGGDGSQSQHDKFENKGPE